MSALLDAIERDDRGAIPALFGPEYTDRLVTPDWDANREARLEIAQAARESHHFETLDDGEVQLIVGAEEWPFPIPLAQTPDDRWHFDTAEGIEVLTDRRIGRNELSALQIVDAYVDAQIAYAKQDRDGDGVLEYADPDDGWTEVAPE